MSDRIRIPKSTPRRGADGYIKLIERVETDAINGFGVRGKIMKPGSMVDIDELRPSDSYPVVPIAVEYVAGGGGPLARGWSRHEQPDLYLLWRWEGLAKGWTEVARSLSTHGTWVLDMGPILRRAVTEARGPQPVQSLGAAEAAIAAALDTALAGLAPSEQRATLAALHDQIAVRLARAA